jgi:hypothetical protein
LLNGACPVSLFKFGTERNAGFAFYLVPVPYPLILFPSYWRGAEKLEPSLRALAIIGLTD